MARNTGHNNPQTWTRVKRIELRDLATDLGNEAVLLNDKWPGTGEGRAIKATAEKISRLLGGAQQTRSLREAFDQIGRAAGDIADILENPFFLSEMAERPIKRRAPNKTPMGLLIKTLVNETQEYIANYKWPPEPNSAEKISQIVPDQRLGPVFFDVIGDRIIIRHTPAVPDDADRPNVDAAAIAIQEQGELLAQKMLEGNCDRRIAQKIVDILNIVKSKQDVIRLGIENISAQLVFQNSQEELPDILYTELQAFSVVIGMYVAQFPQWVRFSENAASLEYTSADITRIYRVGTKLSKELEKSSSHVDPEIPQTLKWMTGVIQNPKLAARRAVFASIRTIENLISIILRTFSRWLSSLEDGINNGTKRAATAVTIISLLYAAANAGLKLYPSSTLGSASGWVRTASEIVLKELGE